MKGIGFGGKRPTAMKRVSKSSNQLKTQPAGKPASIVKAPILGKGKFSFKEESANQFQAMKRKKGIGK